jgi:tRNA threonylcarbamoyladenosine biosynthesis protein TsaE
MDKRWKVNAIEELEAVAIEFLKLFPEPTIFAFDGEMSAGKTTFIAQILKQLGVQEIEGSPTYSIINEYEINSVKIYHLDCYRIEHRNEILNLGLDELLDEKAYFFIEWAEKIDFILPTKAIWVYIRCDETKRKCLKCEKRKVHFTLEFQKKQVFRSEELH